jgi:hypothetical protein
MKVSFVAASEDEAKSGERDAHVEGALVLRCI